MWPVVVVLLSPLLDPLPGLLDRLEPVDIQTFLPKARIEVLDKLILHGLSGANEVETNAVLISLFIQGLRGKFGAVIDPDHIQQAICQSHLVQHLRDQSTARPHTNLESRTLTAKVNH